MRNLPIVYHSCISYHCRRQSWHSNNCMWWLCNNRSLIINTNINVLTSKIRLLQITFSFQRLKKKLMSTYMAVIARWKIHMLVNWWACELALEFEAMHACMNSYQFLFSFSLIHNNLYTVLLQQNSTCTHTTDYLSNFSWSSLPLSHTKCTAQWASWEVL
jgi:hypothetical protein